MNENHRAEAYARFFETLRPQTPLASYEALYEPDVYFEDPFHKVKGLDSLVKLFRNMFNTLETPVFSVDEIVCSGGVAYLRWEFSYRRNTGGPIESFEGVSRVQFTASGRVSSHIDYWDAAHNVYERLPLIGKAVALLRSRFASA